MAHNFSTQNGVFGYSKAWDIYKQNKIDMLTHSTLTISCAGELNVSDAFWKNNNNIIIIIIGLLEYSFQKNRQNMNT